METTTDPDGILKNREGLFKICPQTLVEDELQKDGSCINQTLGTVSTGLLPVEDLTRQNA